MRRHGRHLVWPPAVHSTSSDHIKALCIKCDLTRKPECVDTMPDFTRSPMGTIRGGAIDLETVKRINIWIAKCAEDLVLCSDESDYVRDLTERYARFRVETESKVFRRGRGFVVANRTRVIERKRG